MHNFTGMTKITSISVQRIPIQLCTLITTSVLKKLLAFLSCVTQQQTCKAASYASGPCFKYLNKKLDWVFRYPPHPQLPHLTANQFNPSKVSAAPQPACEQPCTFVFQTRGKGDTTPFLWWQTQLKTISKELPIHDAFPIFSRTFAQSGEIVGGFDLLQWSAQHRLIQLLQQG